MNGDDRSVNSRQAWEAAQKARAHSPLVGVLERMGAVVAWKGAPEDWKDYAKDLKQILKRYRDPYLKLAVIGDFSCGKSTFLNAVIGMDLLKTALMATTAVPTMLRWDGEPDSGVRLTAVRADGFAMDVTGKHRDAFEYYINKALPDDVGAMIDAITTDNGLVHRLRQAEVGLPAQEGRWGLCLVDTPGVNPGAGDTKEHVAATRRVLRQSADSAIVLFPAERVFTASLQDFLLENAEHFLNSAIFIVTKADAAQDDEEVEALRQFVVNVLEEIGVRSPTVYCMAARDALRYDLGKPLAPGDALWSRRFHRDMGEIFGNLNRRREAIAVESTGSMLHAMIEPLKKDLTAMRAALKERKDALERWSPRAMRKDCIKLVQAYKKSVTNDRAKYYAWTDNGVDQALDARMKRVENHIREKNTATTLNWYLGHGLKDDLADVEAPIQEVLGEAGNALHEDYERFARQMVDCLNRYKINIAGAAATKYVRQAQSELAVDLAVSGEAGKNPTALSTVFDTLGGAGEVLEDLFHLEIGDAIVDLFGTVINLLEGVFSLFMSMKRRQDDAIRAVSKQLEGTNQRIKGQCREALRKQEQALTSAADELLNRLEEDYRHIFDRKQQQYQEEMLSIRAEIAECEHQLKELEECETIVRRERKKSAPEGAETATEAKDGPEADKAPVSEGKAPAGRQETGGREAPPRKGKLTKAEKEEDVTKLRRQMMMALLERSASMSKDKNRSK